MLWRRIEIHFDDFAIGTIVYQQASCGLLSTVYNCHSRDGNIGRIPDNNEHTRITL